jgi:hypothetical protein
MGIHSRIRLGTPFVFPNSRTSNDTTTRVSVPHAFASNLHASLQLTLDPNLAFNVKPHIVAAGLGIEIEPIIEMEPSDKPDTLFSRERLIISYRRDLRRASSLS